MYVDYVLKRDWTAIGSIKVIRATGLTGPYRSLASTGSYRPLLCGPNYKAFQPLMAPNYKAL